MPTISTLKPMYSLSLAVIVLTHLTACPSRHQGAHAPDDCSAPKLEFMVAKSDYNRDQVIKLAGEFKASIEADAKKIKLLQSGDASASLSPEFSNTIKNVQHTEAIVSQEFYQQSIAYRQAVCNTERQLREGYLSTPKHREKAQENLLKFSEVFANIQAKEEKKNN